VSVNLEIICVGNELLIGKILNTNAYWLGKQATHLAVNVKRITVIQDTLEEIAENLNQAIARKPHFIITTGGLGPTFDDKTFEGIAKALNRKLQVNPEALKMVKQRIEEYTKKRGQSTPVEMTKPRVKMAIFPEDTLVVNNPFGTAPAMQVNLQETIVFVLPGVPSEMEAIFNETIAPILKKATGCMVFCERSLFVDNVAESTLAPFIVKVMAENKGVYIKSHPLAAMNLHHIELHLTITAKESEKPEDKLECALSQITELIHGVGGTATRHN
jgi:molybdenum cofactor synthesis domain-containing protein